jgi:hypothetical protein
MACIARIPSIVSLASALFFALGAVERQQFLGMVPTAAAEIPALGPVKRRRLLNVG